MGNLPASASIHGPFLVAMFVALGLLACVTQERRDVTDAQNAYDRCVAAHSESHADCVARKQHLLATQERYEQNSRRAWACDQAQEQCPTPR